MVDAVQRELPLLAPEPPVLCRIPTGMRALDISVSTDQS